MTTSKKLCVGAFAGAHGVHGDARVKSFTGAPADIAAYGPVETEDGKRSFTLKVKRALKDTFLLVSAPEIKSREDAEALKGQKLYIDRHQLPDTDDDEFYIEDLAGLTVIGDQGEQMGVVKAVHNFGGGDILEIGFSEPQAEAIMVAFTLLNFPNVSIINRTITISAAAIDSISTTSEQ